MAKILFFALLRETLGLDELDYPLSEALCVADLKLALAQRGDQWRRLFAEQEVLVAVNQEIVDDQALIKPGDEVAFFPPVTGG